MGDSLPILTNGRGKRAIVWSRSSNPRLRFSAKEPCEQPLYAHGSECSDRLSGDPDHVQMQNGPARFVQTNTSAYGCADVCKPSAPQYPLLQRLAPPLQDTCISLGTLAQKNRRDGLRSLLKEMLASICHCHCLQPLSKQWAMWQAHEHGSLP